MTEVRARPVLLYDGDCGFCTLMVERAIARLRADVDYQPFQTADLGALGVSDAEAAYSVQWVSPAGTISHGSAAAARLLISGRGLWAVLGRAMLVPPVSWLAEVGYRAVTAARYRLPGSIPALAREPADRPGAADS